MKRTPNFLRTRGENALFSLRLFCAARCFVAPVLAELLDRKMTILCQDARQNSFDMVLDELPQSRASLGKPNVSWSFLNVIIGVVVGVVVERRASPFALADLL